jgi:hypothetical protein
MVFFSGIVAVFDGISTRNKKKWKLGSIYPIVGLRKNVELIHLRDSGITNIPSYFPSSGHL